jgi:hypothetical protein
MITSEPRDHPRRRGMRQLDCRHDDGRATAVGTDGALNLQAIVQRPVGIEDLRDVRHRQRPVEQTMERRDESEHRAEPEVDVRVAGAADRDLLQGVLLGAELSPRWC